MPPKIQQIIPYGLQIYVVRSHKSSLLASRLVFANTYTNSFLKLVTLCNRSVQFVVTLPKSSHSFLTSIYQTPPPLAQLRRWSHGNVHWLPTSYPCSLPVDFFLCFRTSSLSISLVSSNAVGAQADAWPHLWTRPSLVWNLGACVSNLVQHKCSKYV